MAAKKVVVCWDCKSEYNRGKVTKHGLCPICESTNWLYPSELREKRSDKKCLK